MMICNTHISKFRQVISVMFPYFIRHCDGITGKMLGYLPTYNFRLNVNFAVNLVKLVSHQLLLYNLAQISSTSQILMHSMTISIFLYCYYTYNIIIINIPSWPVATDSLSFTISKLIAAAQAYFNLGISVGTRKAYRVASADTTQSAGRLTNQLYQSVKIHC